MIVLPVYLFFFKLIYLSTCMSVTLLCRPTIFYVYISTCLSEKTYIYRA